MHGKCGGNVTSNQGTSPAPSGPTYSADQMRRAIEGALSAGVSIVLMRQNPAWDDSRITAGFRLYVSEEAQERLIRNLMGRHGVAPRFP
jgi:hypothetical protein